MYQWETESREDEAVITNPLVVLSVNASGNSAPLTIGDSLDSFMPLSVARLRNVVVLFT